MKSDTILEIMKACSRNSANYLLNPTMCLGRYCYGRGHSRIRARPRADEPIRLRVKRMLKRKKVSLCDPRNPADTGDLRLCRALSDH